MWYRLGILPSAGKFHDRTVVRYLLGLGYDPHIAVFMHVGERIV
jgi:hypothetical protein